MNMEEYYDRELELGRLFQWEKIDNSDDFIILREMHGCKKDILNEKGYRKMIRQLNQIAPDILWKVVPLCLNTRSTIHFISEGGVLCNFLSYILSFQLR